MSFKRLPVAFSGLLILARLVTAADAVGPAMIQIKSIGLDSLTDPHRGSMKWSHGAFLFQSVSPGGGLPPNFYTLDQEGRLISEATAAIPDSAYALVTQSDRRDDNSIVFIGQAWSAYGQPAPLIGLISADGTTERVIRTVPYWPNMLSIAPDGTFWTLGLEMVNDNISDPALNPDAGVLRHFDRSGKLLGSALPQSQFVHDHLAVSRLTTGRIAAAGNRLGWYGPHWGKGGQYTEIDLDSMSMHTYPGLPDIPQTSIFMCFSLTESGNAFLSVYDNKAGHATTYLFDREAPKWAPLKGPLDSQRPGPYLIGVDGDQLVFRDSKLKAFFFSLSH